MMKINGLSITIGNPKGKINKLAVLLPGYLDTKDYLHIKLLAQDLNKIGYQTISFDPTGTWDSDGDISQYCLTQYLKDVKTVIDYIKEKNKNKYDKVILLGHSFGGQAALTYASSHPEICAVVAIMSSYDSSTSAYTGSLLPVWQKTGSRNTKRDLPNNPNQLKEFVVTYSFQEDRNTYNFADCIKNYKNKLLIIAGELDTVADPNNVKQIYDIANEPKEFKLIPGIRHNYRHKKTEIDIVNQEIIEFLKGISKIIIVDENDNIIGSKERNQVQTDDIYRVSGLWITNSKGDILLAQRKFTKSHDPGKWGPAVAGTLEEGESYEENIIKEAHEELGLEDIKPKKGPIRRRYGIHNHFVQMFYLTIDREIDEFKIAEDEVEQIKWFKQQELQELFKEKPEMFIKTLSNWADEFTD